MRFLAALAVAWSPCHGSGSPSGMVDSGPNPDAIVAVDSAGSGSGCVANVGGSITATLSCGAGASLGYDHNMIVGITSDSPSNGQVYVILTNPDPTDQDFATGTYMPANFEVTVAEFTGTQLDQSWAARSSTSSVQKGNFTLGITSVEKSTQQVSGYLAAFTIHGTMHVDCVADDVQTVGFETIDVTF